MLKHIGIRIISCTKEILHVGREHQEGKATTTGAEVGKKLNTC